MRLLALETSARIASVAMLDFQLDTPAFSESGDTQLEENGLPAVVHDSSQKSGLAIAPPESHYSGATPQRRPASSSVTLIRTIQQALAEKNWSPSDVDVVAVTVGPGSFTGLRIGLVTAKTFGYAAKAQVIGVNTLEVLASQARKIAKTHSGPDTQFQNIKVAIDAGRNQLFVGQYPFEYSKSAQLAPHESAPDFRIEEKSTWLRQIGNDEIATGPALSRMQQELSDLKRSGDTVEVAPESCWTPTAASVGLVGVAKVLETKDHLSLIHI